MSLANSISIKLKAQGILFDEDFIETFLLSLKAKPFLILSGISGVGKSVLPKAIMRAVGNENCTPIAVAPDWTDNMDMLGFFNLEGEFIEGEFTTIIKKAFSDPHIPYFVILDEMNLARVEYYFAQILSVMESRFFNDLLSRVEYDQYIFNTSTRSRLLDTGDNQNDVLANLKIPHNVFIIGTVNVDESTHPFSKKVLDRANVLEINNVNLKLGIEDIELEESTYVFQGNTTEFVGTVTNIQELKQQWEANMELSAQLNHIETINLWVNELESFNILLGRLKFNIGLRVRDEVCIYLYYAALNNLDNLREDWWHKYFDNQLVQKLLTRLFGEIDDLEPLLIQLFNKCFKEENGIYDDAEAICQIANVPEEIGIIYPKAAVKLHNMLVDLIIYRNPSVSFWTS